MTNFITVLENGDVRVEQEYFDGEEMAVLDRTFTWRGAYVYEVHPNGAESQVCYGLQLRGSTLMADSDAKLLEVIKRNLHGGYKMQVASGELSV